MPISREAGFGDSSPSSLQERQHYTSRLQRKKYQSGVARMIFLIPLTPTKTASADLSGETFDSTSLQVT